MPTSSQQLDRALARRAPRQPDVQRAALRSIWKPTVNTGFSDVIGSWKIIEMSAPRSRAARRRRQLQRVAAAVEDAARRVDDRVLRRQQAQDRQRRHRLAAARFADQRDGAFARDVEGDALHRLERSSSRSMRKRTRRSRTCSSELGVRRAGSSAHFSFGSSASRSASVKSANAVTSTAIATVAGGELPPLAEDQLVLRLVRACCPTTRCRRARRSRGRTGSLRT